MGDLGYFDEQGRLWYCGRKAHRVVTIEQTLFTEMCEGVFNAHPQVRRTALVGVVMGGVSKPVLCVELEKHAGGADRNSIRRELLDLGCKHAHTRSILTILFHRGFPTDIRHNSKIIREELARWAQKGLSH
jgi:acyl-coenzyme A synthetase/AMP-(fatty) acid ligase